MFKFISSPIVFLLILIAGVLSINANSHKSDYNSIKERDVVKMKIDSFTAIAIKLNNERLYDSSYQSLVDLFYYLQPIGKLELEIDVVQKMIYRIPEKEVKSRIEMNYLLYYVYDAIGKIFDAHDILKKVDIYAAETKDSVTMVKNLNSYGIFYMKTRNYREAVQVLNKALKISSSFDDKHLYKRALRNLGAAYLWSRNHKKTLETYNEVLKIRNDVNSEVHTEIARSYFFEGNFKQAIIYNTLALKEANINKNNGAIYECYRLFGDIYSKNSNLALASNYYTKAFDMSKSISDKREIIKATIPYAKNELKLNRIDKAINLLLFCHELFDYKRKIKNDKALPAEMYLIEVFSDLGNCYLKKYQGNNELQNLEIANKYFDQSIEILEDMRKYHSNPYIVEEISVDNKYIYENAIEAALVSYIFLHDNKYKDKAFLIYQKYGNFNLKKSVAERKALDIAEKNNDIKAKYLRQKIELQNLLVQINDNYSDSLYQLYESLKKTYSDNRDSLIKNNSRFRKLNEDIAYVDSKFIQKNLDGKTSFISYFFGQDNLYQFILSKNKFEINKVNADSLLSKNASSFIGLLSEPDTKLQE
ncbi:MAG: hypothetical protein RLZZ546_3165, partial [Bacteroidota bacterium]